jgi:hypothetical protein
LPQHADDPCGADGIIKEISDTIEDFEKQIKSKNWLDKKQKRGEKSNTLRCKFEPLIREYYNIDEYESMLIEDTLALAVRSFHPRYSTTDIPTLANVSKETSQVYTQTLCEMLNHFGKGSQFKVNGRVIKGNPYSVVQVTLAESIDKNIPVITASDALKKTFKLMEPHLQRKQGRFVFCQNLKVFDGDDLYLLKPMQMRFWSHTAALNDADEIAGSIIQSRKGG